MDISVDCFYCFADPYSDLCSCFEHSFYPDPASYRSCRFYCFCPCPDFCSVFAFVVVVYSKYM